MRYVIILLCFILLDFYTESMCSAYKRMAKFCPNLSFLFTENPFLERYKLAKEAGFKAVESAFPYGISKEDVIAAKESAGIAQILINVYIDVFKNELGYAAIPGKENEFKESLHKTIDLAKSLGASKIHIMSGKINGTPTEANDATYVNNLKYAAGLLEKENLMGVIEPINKYSVPYYYMNSYEKALSVVKNIESPNLKILLDIFHMQQIQGDITHTLYDLMKYCGHVQIAQVPNRNEPNTNGELDYRYILNELKKAGYDDWIGLEYKPMNSSSNTFKWIKEFGYSL